MIDLLLPCSSVWRRMLALFPPCITAQLRFILLRGVHYSMQSFLQYRRFGRQVARQYERDKSKGEALVNHENSDLTSPSESNAPNTSQINVASDSIDTQDPEKGDNPMVNQSMPSSVPGHMIQKRRTGRRGVRAKAVIPYTWRPLPGENPQVQKHQRI